MSKKAWPVKRSSAAAWALAGMLAACHSNNAPGHSANQPTAGYAKSGGAQASIHHNGKEYILSLGGGGAMRKEGSFGLPIPPIAGIKLEEVIEGVGETSAFIAGAAPLAEFMEAFAADFWVINEVEIWLGKSKIVKNRPYYPYY